MGILVIVSQDDVTQRNSEVMEWLNTCATEWGVVRVKPDDSKIPTSWAIKFAEPAGAAAFKITFGRNNE